MDCVVLLLYILAVLIAFWCIRMFLETFELDNLSKRAVFITGCDSGFGHDLAIQCVRKGIPVFAGCYSKKGAQDLESECQSQSGKLDTLMLDVTSDESVKAAKLYLETATQPYGGLHAVVNNAGIVGNFFYDDFLNIDDYKKTAEVNLWGVIRITQAMKSLIKKTKGRLVNVTSICARIGLSGIGPYTVSKFGATAYSDVVRQELRPFGVSVHVLEPGFFKTPLIKQETLEGVLKQVWKNCPEEVKSEYGEEFVIEGQARTNMFLDGVSSAHVEWVVNAYLHAITARFPRLRYQIGWDANLLFIPLSLLPSRIQDAFFATMEKLINMPIPAEMKKQ